MHCLAAVASGAHSRSALEAHPLWARRLAAAAPSEPMDDLVSGPTLPWGLGFRVNLCGIDLQIAVGICPAKITSAHLGG